MKTPRATSSRFVAGGKRLTTVIARNEDVVAHVFRRRPRGRFFLFPSRRGNCTNAALADLAKEVALVDPQISPDGSRVALLVGRNDLNHDSIPLQIVLIDIASGGMHPLPLSQTDLAFVRWSPSGDRLAYLAGAPGQAKQLYITSPPGSGVRKLTNAPQGVDYFVWRPDGNSIAYATDDSPQALRGSARFNTSFEVGDNDYRTTAPPLPSHLWLARTDGGAPTRLTSGASIIPSGSLSLTQPYLDALVVPQHFPDQFFCWVGNGRSIAYTKAPDAYNTHWDRAVMELRDVMTGRERALTRHHGLEAGCDTSPDGTRIAYWYPHEGQPLAASSIFVTNSAGDTNGIEVTRFLDRSPWVMRWMPDGRSLLILAHDRTRERMWLASLDGAARELDLGDLNASAASVSRTGAIAFIASGPKRPVELYVMQSAHSPARRLTYLNDHFATLQLGAVTHILWRNDGFDENGVLTFPPDFVEGKKYPLVLQIHGWPQYASQEAFDTDYPGLTQLLAAHGFVVFEPNYRGSDNMGSAFETAIVGDTVDGPSRDIMAGIAAVERRGFVDESRIGVSGWSYGGLLTAWLIGHRRWRAAVAGAAPTDLPVDYAIGSYNILNGYFYGGPLWASHAGHQLYVDQSPITYAWNITTPTLIMSTVGDTSVPVTHSYELFHALRDRGVPTQFIAYQSNEHVPTDPVLIEDIFRRWVEWFDRYLR